MYDRVEKLLVKTQKRDVELEKRIKLYDQLISEGKVPASSKVIPVNKSLDSKQWILPAQQAAEILRNARRFALGDCGCRSKQKHCDKPVEDICFSINDAAEERVRKGIARYVSLDEALERLNLADEYGLVHLTIYNPEQHVFALCSCCECCCHELRMVQMYERGDLVIHSDYIAVVATESCINCGVCIDRCAFGAQEQHDMVVYHSKKCYGCGLCVTTCPVGAITLNLRTPTNSC